MIMQLPVLVTNFKTYESAIGDKALSLAKIHEEVARERGVSLAIAVSALDLEAIIKQVTIPVFLQHVDLVDYGSFTGFLPAVAAKSMGAFGTLLNHAEHQLSMEILGKTIEKCKQVGLFTLVCAENAQKGAEIMGQFHPDMIAVEPPELIGGDISVSTARPELIKEAIRLIGGDHLLVGAGVKIVEDIRMSLQLGASRVLLASGITKASDPRATLKSLADGLVS